MNVVRRSRCGGKTTELIRRASQVQNAVIVVHSYILARQITLDYGIETITFRRLLEGVLYGRDVVLFIDNLDTILQDILGPLVVDTITVTVTSE